MDDRAEGALDVGLEDDAQLLGLACLDLPVEVLERGVAGGLADLAASSARARPRPCDAGDLLVRDDAQDVARLGHLVEAEETTARRRARPS